MDAAIDFLATYLEPLADELTPQQAQIVLATRPSDALIARVTALSDKANLGTLTALERTEYEHYIDVDDVIGLLKVKARSLLQQPNQ